MASALNFQWPVVGLPQPSMEVPGPCTALRAGREIATAHSHNGALPQALVDRGQQGAMRNIHPAQSAAAGTNGLYCPAQSQATTSWPYARSTSFAWGKSGPNCLKVI